MAKATQEWLYVNNYDPVQACCSCVQVSSLDRTVVSHQWARVHGWFQGPEMLPLRFLTVTECPSYMAVHRQWSDLPCCCCPYLEQSAPTCHVHTLYLYVFWGRIKAFFFRHSFPWLSPQLRSDFYTRKSFFYLITDLLITGCAVAAALL